MDAKTYCKKTAAFAGWLIQNVPADLDEDTMDNWMNNPDGTKKFLSGLNSPKMTPAKPITFLSIVATTNLDAVAGKKTKKCFVVGNRYYYRDADFDNWLPANQLGADACVITTLAPAKDWKFAEAAAAILGVGAGTNIVLLGNLLIEHGHTMTLPQGEELVDKTERGEKTGMRTDGWGNWFFVETGDPKNPVSVGHVLRDSRGWCAHVRSLDYGYRWNADPRILVRNLDTSKLGL